MKIATFTLQDVLCLEQAPNGGWTIQARSSTHGMGEMPRMLGAYSSAEDLIDALSGALNVSREPELDPSRIIA